MASTLAACGPPITEMRALGHVKRKRGRIGAAAHAVVPCAIAAADDDGDFGHVGAGDGGDHLGAILGDAAGLRGIADHEAGDVLQEQKRNAALVGELDEMRGLLRLLREEDAVVGEDAKGRPWRWAKPVTSV